LERGRQCNVGERDRRVCHSWGSWALGQAISRSTSAMKAETPIRGVGLGCSSPLAPTIRVGYCLPVAVVAS
jgi:hypothetical protein